jgi:hypothetical protein
MEIFLCVLSCPQVSDRDSVAALVPVDYFPLEFPDHSLHSVGISW